mgnify:CR=1 FL=1
MTRSVEQAASLPKVTGKCIACGKRFDIDERMQADAREAGVAFSPCCMFPSVVVKAEVRRGR